MLDVLDKVITEHLPLLLDKPEVWDSIIVNRRKPVTYRVFTYIGDLRVCLHTFEPCHMHEAFMHPHPWAGAFAILAGSYKMRVGYSEDLFKAPITDDAITLHMARGSRYEILDPRTWHSVIPLETTHTVMVNNPPWEKGVAHAQVRTTAGKDLDKMAPEAMPHYLGFFRNLLGLALGEAASQREQIRFLKLICNLPKDAC